MTKYEAFRCDMCFKRELLSCDIIIAKLKGAVLHFCSEECKESYYDKYYEHQREYEEMMTKSNTAAEGG